MSLLTLLMHRAGEGGPEPIGCTWTYAVDEGATYAPDGGYTYAPDGAYTYAPDSAFNYSVDTDATYDPCAD